MLSSTKPLPPFFIAWQDCSVAFSTTCNANPSPKPGLKQYPVKFNQRISCAAEYRRALIRTRSSSPSLRINPRGHLSFGRWTVLLIVLISFDKVDGSAFSEKASCILHIAALTTDDSKTSVSVTSDAPAAPLSWNWSLQRWGLERDRHHRARTPSSVNSASICTGSSVLTPFWPNWMTVWIGGGGLMLNLRI